MSLLQLFCSVDDFMRDFAPHLKAMQLAAGKQRERQGQLYPSEVMTILIHFHQSHYRTFKAYYTEHVQSHLANEFPHAGQLPALCGSHSVRPGSPAGVLAKLLWSLHGHQLH